MCRENSGEEGANTFWQYCKNAREAEINGGNNKL